MKLTNASEIRVLLAELEIKPAISMGQNFLTDENILNILLQQAELKADDCILEIGPGLGTVTERLCQTAQRVVAIEKDTRFCAFLRDNLCGEGVLELHAGDALDFDFTELFATGVNKVVSNLPYSSGGRMLMEIVGSPNRPELILVMVQLEVGERLQADPGGKDYGLLSLLSQMYYDVAVVKRVSSGSFTPRPRVSSALVCLRRLPQPRVELRSSNFYRELIKWAFSQRRKQLCTILRHLPQRMPQLSAEEAVLLLEGLDILPRRRPEELSVTKWGELANALNATQGTLVRVTTEEEESAG